VTYAMKAVWGSTMPFCSQRKDARLAERQTKARYKVFSSIQKFTQHGTVPEGKGPRIKRFVSYAEQRPTCNRTSNKDFAMAKQFLETFHVVIEKDCPKL